MSKLAEAEYPCSTVYELIFIQVRSLISANTFILLWWEKSIVDEELIEEFVRQLDHIYVMVINISMTQQ